MITVTLSEFKKNINDYLDNVIQNVEPIIIMTGKDSGVAMISLNEFNSWLATHHELTSKENETRLDSAIAKLGG
jgi:antitoxin YefM